MRTARVTDGRVKAQTLFHDLQTEGKPSAGEEQMEEEEEEEMYLN